MTMQYVLNILSIEMVVSAILNFLQVLCVRKESDQVIRPDVVFPNVNKAHDCVDGFIWSAKEIKVISEPCD